MPITLNHTIVPSHDKEQSAQFFARIFGVKYGGPVGHFAQVRVNEELALDYDNRERFDSHHYAFVVSDNEFDTIFGRGLRLGEDHRDGLADVGGALKGEQDVARFDRGADVADGQVGGGQDGDDAWRAQGVVLVNRQDARRSMRAAHQAAVQ